MLIIIKIMSYIARFIVNIRSISRLFPRVFLIYSQSRNHRKSCFYYLLKSYFDTCLSWISCVGLWMNGEWFEISWISIKATHPDASGFYMFHCFNISKHISVSVLFFTISISSFMFLCWILKIVAPGVGSRAFICYIHDFSDSGVGVSHFLCARRLGNSPFQKKFPGGEVRLGIDWYIIKGWIAGNT